MIEYKMAESKTAIFASGCFWGTEYHFQRAPGVLSTRVGYTGGHKDNPTYREVCTGTTGHAEAIEVVYDPDQTDYETLARLFFETHDPTQIGGQGPDIGDQYRSVVFYVDDEQRIVTEKLIGLLTDMGYTVATEVEPASKFWPAEDYHQQYYDKTGKTPYCHIYTPRFTTGVGVSR
jgi:peptide methionine sulfoxide reductase msrA/msrB